MDQLVGAAIGTEVVIERLGEDKRVSDQDPARMVADQQHRPLSGYVSQTPHIGPEVQPRHRPPGRQGPLDVRRIPNLKWVLTRTPGRRARNVRRDRGTHTGIGPHQPRCGATSPAQQIARTGHRRQLPHESHDKA